MPTDFAGYRGLWEFDDWELETLTIKQLPASGHSLTILATSVPAKANAERQGLSITDAGARPAYTRKFYFAATYYNGNGSTQSVASYLSAGNVLADTDGNEWSIESVSNPGGADEHFEVLTVRRPQS